MSDKWRSIWSKKQQLNDNNISLESLIKADGFDTGVGSYTSESWNLMVDDFCNRVKIKNTDNVIELGCGSGAFIFAANNICKANWFGIDYSESLIKTAIKAIPEGNFIVDEALNENFSEIEFDVVFSHSVFHYFPNKTYAENVLKLWCSKLKKGGFLVLLDINDAKKEKTYHAERAKEYSSPEEYEANYQGLSHLFFDKIELTDFLNSIGMFGFEFIPHKVPEYGNSKFRFNLICKKC